jgi:hypothetical protein
VFHIILAIMLFPQQHYSSSQQQRWTVLSAVKTEFLYTLYTNFRVQRAVVWLRQSDLGLSLWKPRFNPGLVHVRFVVYSVTGTTGCIDEVQLSSVNITAPLVHTHHLYTSLTRKMSR